MTRTVPADSDAERNSRSGSSGWRARHSRRMNSSPKAAAVPRKASVRAELAARLEVEAPHITRQVQRLAQAGYAERAPDPDDRRAQLIRLTPSGKQAARRIRQTGRKYMQAALAHWAPEDLHQLTTLFHRMVDDFITYAAEHERGQPGS
jgi:DNA-binding MarR family transcriptional regulator